MPPRARSAPPTPGPPAGSGSPCCPSGTPSASRCWTTTSTCGRTRPPRRSPSSSPPSPTMGEQFGFDCRGPAALPGGRAHQPRAHRRQLVRASSMAPRPCWSARREMGKALGLKPRARIVGFASIGSEPTIMLTGPGRRPEKALKRCGMQAGDIDLFELNEAFASVVLRFMQELDVPHDQINVNGGAIAMGHPLGATGAMILGTVLDELERREKAHGADQPVHRCRHGHRHDHRAGAEHDPGNGPGHPHRRRCRRHRHAHHRPARPVDERHHAGADRRAGGAVDRIAGDAAHQGRHHHLGQAGLHRRRRPDGHRQHLRQRRQRPGADARDQPLLGRPAQAGDQRQARGRRDQRHGAGRRARALPRLPLPRAQQRPEGRRRPARSPGGPAAGRRRHAAAAAADRHPARAGADDPGHPRGAREGEGAWASCTPWRRPPTW